MNNARYTREEGPYREVIDGVLRVEIPPDTGVARWWHANGVLAKEVFMLDGMPHGVCLEWHENAMLAREIPYQRGFVNGMVKQWNRDGHLLGAYELQMGRGIIREWYEDGSLKTEIEVLGGGSQRGTIWDETGRSRHVYVWMDHPVSRTEFIRRSSVADRTACGQATMS